MSDMRTSIIKKLRIALPVIATSLLVSVLVFSDRKDPIEARPIEEIVSQKMGENELLNPVLTAHDSEDRPFTIISDRAFQKIGDDNNVFLDKPKATLHFDVGTNLSLEGDNGAFAQDDQILNLDGAVEFKHSDAYTLKTQSIQINVDQQTAVSTMPISGYGPTGDIEASGMTANGQESIIIFNGPASLTINNQPKEEINE
jgi:lipopolysaccharide export system protein LptC